MSKRRKRFGEEESARKDILRHSESLLARAAMPLFLVVVGYFYGKSVGAADAKKAIAP